MNILNKPIEMIAIHDTDGKIKPIRFRVTTNDEEQIVVPIKSVQHSHEEKIKGTKEVIRRFLCLVKINDYQRLCEIEYNLYTMKWTLVKM